MSETTALSHDAFSAIDKEIAKYPPERKSSAVMAALAIAQHELGWISKDCLLYTSPSPRDRQKSRMPSSA